MPRQHQLCSLRQTRIAPDRHEMSGHQISDDHLTLRYCTRRSEPRHDPATLTQIDVATFMPRQLTAALIVSRSGRCAFLQSEIVCVVHPERGDASTDHL
jgi:hypothetical protein